MKKLIAVLIVFLLILTFISCVDNKQTDKEGDVTLPQTAESSQETYSGGNGGGLFINEDGNLEFVNGDDLSD